MFQVRGCGRHPRTKYDMHIYTVYAVDQANPAMTLFLIRYNRKWVWEEAGFFEPVEEVGGPGG